MRAGSSRARLPVSGRLERRSGLRLPIVNLSDGVVRGIDKVLSWQVASVVSITQTVVLINTGGLSIYHLDNRGNHGWKLFPLAADYGRIHSLGAKALTDVYEYSMQDRAYFRDCMGLNDFSNQ
ncbi:hypothetical protein ElyMa_005206900 [Elysia marginata]|uniref:Uncharacterized protein n=1 Tax=Elysia marginata TaxID=1093978 RepID=A0AAV4JV43_9GAST|nr:hypothetical protein ElyMa_005206900 [Elysia marginata]